MTVFGKSGGGQVARAGHMAGSHSRTRLGFLAGETSCATGIGNLLLAAVNDGAHC